MSHDVFQVKSVLHWVIDETSYFRMSNISLPKKPQDGRMLMSHMTVINRLHSPLPCLTHITHPILLRQNIAIYLKLVIIQQMMFVSYV